MKNSFYLVIPPQENKPERSVFFEEKSLQSWINELPLANPGLTTRLLSDLVREFNRLKIKPQFRLDALEILRSSFLNTEEYLRFRLVKEGFPKREDDQKIFNILVDIEKEFTLGYWIVVKELTHRKINWLQGKSVVLSLQRVISGLSNIVVTHYLMNSPVPDWVWIDLHSLYRLSVKTKKDSSRIPKSLNEAGKTMSVSDTYHQILLLSLAQPSGLMQREIIQVFNFTEPLSGLLTLEKQPAATQPVQCVILTDEDQEPRYIRNSMPKDDSSVLFVNLTKLYKTLENKEKFISKTQTRFNSMTVVKNNLSTVSSELFDYLALRWSGVELRSSALFDDRQDRYISIGLESTHQLQDGSETINPKKLEFLVESTSKTALACQFNETGKLSIGSLISFRKKDMAINKRVLGVVNKIVAASLNEKITFEVQILTGQFFAVTYRFTSSQVETQKALLYGAKTEGTEKSYIILESFNLKEGDVIRMTLNQESFPIILRDRKNIGIGYWQFECRRLEEETAKQIMNKKK